MSPLQSIPVKTQKEKLVHEIVRKIKTDEKANNLNITHDETSQRKGSDSSVSSTSRLTNRTSLGDMTQRTLTTPIEVNEHDDLQSMDS